MESNERKYVLFEILYTPPEFVVDSNTLEHIKTNMTKIRNFHSFGNKRVMIELLFVQLALTHIASTKINATLISMDEIYKLRSAENVSTFPTVIPILFSHSEVLNVSYYWNQYFPGRAASSKLHEPGTFTVQLPRFSYQKDELLNFYYCGIPKKLKISPWTFSLFTDPFDVIVWLSIGTAFTLVVIILISEAENGEAAIIVLSMLSSLLSFGCEPPRKRSKLFILWMVVSLILIFFYSGAITSTLISPPEDDVVTTWSELDKRDYTLSTSVPLLEIMKSSVTGVKSKLTESIHKLLQNFTIVDLSEEAIKSFAFSEYIFDVNFWAAALKRADYCASLIKVHAQNQRKNETKCYVGQELVFSTQNYFAFLPPSNDELFQAFQSILEAGIVGRFTKEFYGMLISTRVQDRVRVISETKIMPREEAVVVVLKFEGKTVTVFLFWILCLFYTLLFFFSELIWFQIFQTG